MRGGGGLPKPGIIAFAALVVGSAASTVSAAGAPSAAALAPYEQTEQRIEVSPGRFMHIVCMGAGSPTVVFNAGGAGWSGNWASVQPVIARRAKTCAWDRAGNGLSSGSDEPQDVVHIEMDLERALEGAGVTGSLVFVAHSMGSFEALRFADRHPERLAGLVLVDPSYPGQYEALRRAVPALMAYSDAQDKRYLDGVRRCLAGLREGHREPPPPDCLNLRAAYPRPLREALATIASDPLYWAAFLSDFESDAQNSMFAINPARNYGDVPVIVLQAGKHGLPGAPAEVQGEVQALDAEIARGQQTMATISTRVSFTPVPDAGHAIFFDKPDAVTKAIDTILDEVQQSARP